MENKDEILTALEEFSKRPSPGQIPHVLEEYLCRVASTGVTLFPWNKLKPLLLHKLNLKIDEYHEKCPMDSQTVCPNVEAVSYDDMRKRLTDSLNQFTGIPFTIQRLCELVTGPMNQYKKADKFMRGVEKNLVVITTVDHLGNRIVSDSKAMSNGIDPSPATDLSYVPEHMMDSPMFPPAPTNSPATSSSWYSSLSNVVDSPSSYPNWQHLKREATKDDVTTVSSSENNESLSDSCQPPPCKILKLDDSEDSKETNAIAPLLTELLSHNHEHVRNGKAEVENGTSESCETSESCGTSESCDSTDSVVKSSENDSVQKDTDVVSQEDQNVQQKLEEPQTVPDNVVTTDSTGECSENSAAEKMESDTTNPEASGSTDCEDASTNCPPEQTESVSTVDAGAVDSCEMVQQVPENSDADAGSESAVSCVDSCNENQSNLISSVDSGSHRNDDVADECSSTVAEPSCSETAMDESNCGPESFEDKPTNAMEAS